MKLTRRKILAALSAFPLGGLLGYLHIRYFEPSWFEVTAKDLKIRHLKKPLKVLHLSDLHASPSVPLEDIEKAIDLALEQNADMALLTGDYISWKLPQPKKYRRILKKLADQMPTYACLGNHDGGDWAAQYGVPEFTEIAELLDGAGIQLLFNEATELEIKGQPLQIVGLGDYWSDDCKPELVLHEERQQDDPIIVLSHNPDSKELLEPYDWDLTLCGHTHGGQLVVPLFGWRPFLPVRDKSFAEGVLTWGERHLHITRGIGNLHGLRFNCRPEISVLNLS